MVPIPPTERGHRNILVMVDYSTKAVEVVVVVVVVVDET